MTTQDIIEYLKQTQSDAPGKQEAEEIFQSELDQISGARGDWFARLGYEKRF